MRRYEDQRSCDDSSEAARWRNDGTSPERNSDGEKARDVMLAKISARVSAER
jgi:hypothetical protein